MTFQCLICKAQYEFKDHHRCLDHTFVDLTDKAKASGYRPSRREYYREYMRKHRAKGKAQ